MPPDRDKRPGKAVRSASLKQQIVDALILDIRRGVIAPGSLISAKRISEEHGVSRTPAREAVDTLVSAALKTPLYAPDMIFMGERRVAVGSGPSPRGGGLGMSRTWR